MANEIASALSQNSITYLDATQMTCVSRIHFLMQRHGGAMWCLVGMQSLPYHHFLQRSTSLVENSAVT